MLKVSFHFIRTLSHKPIPPTSQPVKQLTHLSDDLSQTGVAHDQPAPGGDTVGLVLKLLRVNLVKILEPGRNVEHQSDKLPNIFVTSYAAGFLQVSLHSVFDDI